MARVFHKPTFERIPEERQERILRESIKEFAANGYLGTNINAIAENAGISIGSMYSYFASKEDLFLTIVNRQLALLERLLSSIDTETSFFLILEELFRVTMKSALQHSELSQIYLNITTSPLAAMASRISGTMEGHMAVFLRRIIGQAKQAGEIEPGLNEDFLAFCIDNLLMMFQFSFSSEYYRQRMRLYLGEKLSEDGEELIRQSVGFVRNQLRHSSLANP